ncbi:MAG: XRE family transcriptional regulator [Chloroflexi bacterium]|nr:XRE family transcriptional regulator [Chloroflexota bacterium]
MELGLGQRELALSAQVTESYISQLLNRKKLPPTPDRTQMYERMESFLELPKGELSKLAALQRVEELKARLVEPPTPSLMGTRTLVLRKCALKIRKRVRAIFELQALGEFEWLITNRLLEVAKKEARRGMERDGWLDDTARLSNLNHEKMRRVIEKFLNADVFQLSAKNLALFWEPLIESWDINFDTFSMVVVLNPNVATQQVRRFEFVESVPESSLDEEPGFSEFLQDPQFKGNVTKDEIAFLRRLKFGTKRPTPLYYYRELQNLRDPLHFAPEMATAPAI